MKLSSKLYLGFTSVLALLVATTILTSMTMSRITRNVKSMDEHSQLMMEIKERELGHLDWASGIQAGLIDTSSRQLEAETDPHKCKFGKWFYSPERETAEKENPELAGPLKEIEAHHTALHGSAVKMNEALAMNNREGAMKVYYSDTIPFLDQVRSDFDAITEAIKIDRDATEKTAMAYASRTVKLIVVLSIAALLLGAVITRLIVSRVMRQLGGDPSEVVRAAHRIADGDLTVSLSYDRKRVNSALACLDRMTASLEEIVSEITVSANALVASVEQISSGNQDLSQRSAEQAASIEEIAATLEETTSMIKENSDNSQKAQEVSAEASRMAEAGGLVIIEAVNSINEVNESSKKISQISSVINEIAFQTNLLALNAAVEAARAGEQGKGFAVVAEEVRNLAQRSGEAAREIASLIHDSVSKVENATALANKGKEALEEIISAVKDTGRLIAGVAMASEEQLRGIDQISTAISEIDSLTQQDASLVEQTAASSEEVAGQAQGVLTLIRGFKTNRR